MVLIQNAKHPFDVSPTKSLRTYHGIPTVPSCLCTGAHFVLSAQNVKKCLETASKRGLVSLLQTKVIQTPTHHFLTFLVLIICVSLLKPLQCISYSILLIFPASKAVHWWTFHFRVLYLVSTSGHRPKKGLCRLHLACIYMILCSMRWATCIIIDVRIHTAVLSICRFTTYYDGVHKGVLNNILSIAMCFYNNQLYTLNLIGIHFHAYELSLLYLLLRLSVL